MTATYFDTIPTDRDWVRSRLDDIGRELDGDQNPIFFRQDEEIDALLVLYENKWKAAAHIAESIGVELAKKADAFTSEEGMSVRWSKRSDAFFAIARSLRLEIRAAELEAETALYVIGSVHSRRAGDAEVGEYSSRPVFG